MPKEVRVHRERANRGSQQPAKPRQGGGSGNS